MTQAFSDFHLRAATCAALARQGITSPTPIQASALPPLLEGRDVVGQARTGSGKTLAFVLPMLESLRPNVRGVQALVLVPTRELANQVSDVIAGIVGRSGPRVARLYGGRPYGAQAAAIRDGAQIVVGTPGRTLDLLRQRSLSLDGVRYLVLDEADEMLDRGFAPDVERILAFTPRERQTAMFSATVAGWLTEIAAKHLVDPVHIRVDPEPAAKIATIDQTVLRVPEGQRQAVLEKLLDRRPDGLVMVFARTKHGVKKLGTRLQQKGFPATVLQGNLSQNARDRAMAEFRSGRLPILLATNVAARGIDVSEVSQVINYELPETAEIFTHRNGRTGRMGRYGESITLVAPSDSAKWNRLERDIGRKLPVQEWTEPLDTPAQPPERAVQPHRPARSARPAAERARPAAPAAQARPRRRRYSGFSTTRPRNSSAI
ncbi:MAG: DEAD/DEAH box helicase [Chloroflexota bacterium]